MEEWKAKLVKDYGITNELAAMKEARESILRMMEHRLKMLYERIPDVEQELELAKLNAASNVQGSNADARKLALERELSTNADYQIALKKKLDLRAVIDGLDAEINSCERKFSAARHSLEWKTAVLRLFGGGGD